MKRWLRRFGYLFFVIFWLMIMCFPTFAFTLAMREQIQVGNIDSSHLRVFMVVEEDTNGIGIELTRPLLSQASCQKTSVGYLLWEGGKNNQNVSYCQCFDPETDAPLPVDENSCN